MSVERRYGMIKPIEGQEIILKGEQTQAIRMMLENKLKDLSVIFEAQSDTAQASYFLRTYYRNSYDPVGMLCYRFSAFVLPGTVPAECAAVGKRVIDLKDGSIYFLEQVHVNTEIYPSLDDLWGCIAEDIELLSED